MEYQEFQNFLQLNSAHKVTDVLKDCFENFSQY